MAPIGNIIFDFDGTLVDTAPLIVRTMQETIRQMGLPWRTDEECRATIGLRLEEIPAALWPGIPDIGGKYAENYRRIFDELKRPLDVRVFPGVAATLHHLCDSGIGMAIASSRSHRSLQEYVDLFALDDCFCVLVGGDDVTHGKPAPDPVLSILETQGWNASATLTVGDASVDILMGKAAGTQTCAVTYGNGTLRELETTEPDFVIGGFNSLLAIVNLVDSGIIRYVETEILPRYAAFDKAHQTDHALMVIAQSLKLAAREPVLNRDMLYVAAAFHDLGLVNGRGNHHIDSRRILEADEFVNAHFTPDQIRLMGEAVEDHRASKGSRPRNPYGLIVAEADRFIDPETIIRRTIQYGLKNYPGLDMEGHYNRTVEHLTRKYGYGGYMKIWIPWSDNVARLDDLRRLIGDPALLREIFNRLFIAETDTCP